MEKINTADICDSLIKSIKNDIDRIGALAIQDFTDKVSCYLSKAGGDDSTVRIDNTNDKINFTISIPRSTLIMAASKGKL